MLNVWQRFQAEEYAATARAYSHRFETVRMSGVRQTLSPAVPSDTTLADPCQRKTLLMCVLSTKLPSTGHTQSAPAHPFG